LRAAAMRAGRERDGGEGGQEEAHSGVIPSRGDHRPAAERFGPLQLGRRSFPLRTRQMGKVFEALLKALKENCPEFERFPTSTCLERCWLIKVCDTIRNMEKMRRPK